MIKGCEWNDDDGGSGIHSHPCDWDYDHEDAVLMKLVNWTVLALCLTIESNSFRIYVKF